MTFAAEGCDQEGLRGWRVCLEIVLRRFAWTSRRTLVSAFHTSWRKWWCSWTFNCCRTRLRVILTKSNIHSSIKFLTTEVIIAIERIFSIRSALTLMFRRFNVGLAQWNRWCYKTSFDVRSPKSPLGSSRSCSFREYYRRRLLWSFFDVRGLYERWGIGEETMERDERLWQCLTAWMETQRVMTATLFTKSNMSNRYLNLNLGSVSEVLSEKDVKPAAALQLDVDLLQLFLLYL